MDLEEAGKKLGERIMPIKDSLMVPCRDSYGCVSGCDIKAKDVLHEEGITEEHIVINRGKRIGREEAGIISSLGFFEVRIRRPGRVALISVEKAPAKERFSFRKKNTCSGIPAMIDFSLREMRFETVMITVCTDEEKNLLREVRKGIRDSDILIISGGILGDENCPVCEVLKTLGAALLFRNAGSGPDALNGAYLLEKKVILCLSSDPEAAMNDFDVLFKYCADKLMRAGS